MRAWGKKFICIFNQDKYSTSWISFLTWRIGHKGPYIVRAESEDELCAKLRRLDPSVRFNHLQQLNSGERVNENAQAR